MHEPVRARQHACKRSAATRIDIKAVVSVPGASVQVTPDKPPRVLFAPVCDCQSYGAAQHDGSTLPRCPGCFGSADARRAAGPGRHWRRRRPGWGPPR